jgi:hypothetical protein
MADLNAGNSAARTAHPKMNTPPGLIRTIDTSLPRQDQETHRFAIVKANPTISRDNTRGDNARRSNLLAYLGKKTCTPTTRYTRVRACAIEEHDSNQTTSFSDHETERRSAASVGDTATPNSKLIVTGIHPKLSESEVARLFSKYCGVEKCDIMRHPHTEESRGFGFVEMVTSDQADTAKHGLQGMIIKGRTLNIEKFCLDSSRSVRPSKYNYPSL